MYMDLCVCVCSQAACVHFIAKKRVCKHLGYRSLSPIILLSCQLSVARGHCGPSSARRVAFGTSCSGLHRNMRRTHQL